MNIINRRAMRLGLAGALMLLGQFAPQLAHAQYSWIDDKGTRVFSDRPPPPGTPAGRILKAPHRADKGADDAPAPAAAAPAPAEAPKQPSLAEREADYRKRQAQHQEEEKKAQDEAARKDAMCMDARRQEVQLTSGVRIAQMDVKGERSYMSDEERSNRLARARQALAGCR